MPPFGRERPLLTPSEGPKSSSELFHCLLQGIGVYLDESLVFSKSSRIEFVSSMLTERSAERSAERCDPLM